jgi:predicted nucleic acid-binding protein
MPRTYQRPITLSTISAPPIQQIAEEQTLPELPITDDVWAAACGLASRCRKAGKTAPALDVLIAACARHHGVEVEHADSHFDFLMTL